MSFFAIDIGGRLELDPGVALWR